MEGKINLSTDENLLIPHWIYKILPRAAWQAARERGVYTGVGIDVSDGYVHFSGADQVAGTLERHFAGDAKQGQADLVLIGFDPADLGPQLRYESARGGALFAHLYAPLPTALARAVWRLEASPQGWIAGLEADQAGV
jgi:uncharacterized protein (DUF952 family)